jgi:murein DD-endopeptidase MepM/ murein hydrolase activator NlpD
MGHIKFDKGNGTKKGLNGFYLALAICLVAIGGVAVATFVSSIPKVHTEISGSSSQSTVATTNPTRPVGEVVTNIPDDRTNEDETTAVSSNTKTTAIEADLFILPLTNEVIREFSNNKPVYSPSMNDWRVHNGVDFKGSESQSIKALADGTIVSIGEDPLWGNVVVIDHGYGIKSQYYGIKVTKFKAKDTVKVGDVIGTLSDVPCESLDGPHLHLEILVNNEYVNPIDAIGRDVNYTNRSTEAKTN